METHCMVSPNSLPHKIFFDKAKEIHNANIVHFVKVYSILCGICSISHLIGFYKRLELFS